MLAAVALVVNRRSVWPTLTAPFRRTATVVDAAQTPTEGLVPAGR